MLGRWGPVGAGVQPSLSAVLPVLLGGLELLRTGESSCGYGMYPA